MKRLLFAVTMITPCLTHADENLQSNINGKVSLLCDTKDGAEYVVNAGLFPQTLEVNSSFVNLYHVEKDNNGFRHFLYMDKHTGAQVELAVSKADTYLVIDTQMLLCS